MKKTILLLIAIIPLFLFAQPNALNWEHHFNSSLYTDNFATSIAKNNKFLYQVGSYSGLTDLDPTNNLDTVSGFGTYINKYDFFGNYIWSKVLPNSGYDFGAEIKLDHENNLIIYGGFLGNKDFDPNPLVTYNVSSLGNNVNAYILKLDSNANFIWLNTYTNMLSGSSHKNGIALDNFNNIIMCGAYNDSADFDAGTGTYMLYASNNVQQGFKLKINANGTFNNVKQITAKQFVRPDGCVIDPNNNVYISGEFKDSIDFNTGINTAWLVSDANYRQRFICKYNANDSLIFAKKYGSSNSNTRQDIFINLFDIYIAGNIDTIMDFDPSSNVYLAGDTIENGYILKLDSNGIFNWIMNIKANNNNSFNNIQFLDFDNANNIHALGLASTLNTTDTLDIDPGNGVSEFRYAGQSALYHACYNNAGNLVFMMPIDSTGTPLSSGSTWGITDFTILPNNNLVYTGGVFNGTEDIDIRACTQLISTAAFVGVSMIACYTTCQPSLKEISITACDSAFLNGIYYNRDTTLLKTFTSAICCDSSVQYSITISKIDTSIAQTSAGLQANAINVTYQWVQCPNFTPIVGATAQTYAPTQVGKYAVIISKGNCVDTSNCYSTYNLGLQNATFKEFTLLKTIKNNWIFNVSNAALHSNTNLCIFNNLGQKVMQKSLANLQTYIELNHFAKGLYILQYGDFVQKITVE